MDVYYHRISLILLLLLSFTLESCGQTETKKDTIANSNTVKVNTLKGNFSSQSRVGFDSVQIDSFFVAYPKLDRYQNDIRLFYRNRNFSYAWFEDGQLIEQAGNLINRVLGLEDDGVFKKLFYAKILDSLALNTATHPKSSSHDLNLELLLTGEYFVFSKLAWEGMSPYISKSTEWLLPRKKVDYVVYLDSLIQSPSGEYLVNEPVYRQYNLLKTQLRTYNKLAQQPIWAIINGNAKRIKVSDSALVISQVKKRLFLFSDYQGQLLDTLFDSELNLALIRFQERHGIDPVGKINRETIAELNVPLKDRIKQILVNMERSRWLPVNPQGDYLAVNIPEFKLHVYHDQTLLWSCNAVVGETMHATTLFYGEINQVVFRPYWNVPESIVRQEILPGIRKNPDYLSNHQMENIGTRNGLPIIRQKPGLSNSLGLVKFLFPNSYSIYLHDTPKKSLFNETDRAFSHGCIRISEPTKLASFLLAYDEKWNAKSIAQAMNNGNERSIKLKNKVPVFLTYFTAFVDRNQKLNFRPDVYQLDQKLATMIISGEGSY